MSQTRKENKLTTQNIIAMIKVASISGVVADTVIFPIFRLKTVVMTEGADPKSAQQIKGFRNLCRIIYNKQGLGGFYRGFSPVFISAMPATALLFCGIEITQQVTNHRQFGIAASGIVGQMLCSIVWTPAAVITEARQLFLSKPELQQMNVMGLTKQIYVTQGVKDFFLN